MSSPSFLGRAFLGRLISPIAVLVVGIAPALAQGAAPKLDTANTAWILTASALVLFMTMPGLALFYAGLVRAKNVLSVMMHCVVITCIASVLWLAIGYSLAFDSGNGGLIGSLSKSFLFGVTKESLVGTLPEIVFFTFQMTFAVITPALIVGAYPERIRFGAVVLISSLWLMLVYVPICHWVWGDGWLMKRGVMDFAGGLVVHATAGTSALVIAAMLGPRDGFPKELHPPHNPGMAMTGAGMLWVGWYGFNGGSALTADGAAGMAIAATHISAASAGLAWMLIEYFRFGRASMIGAVTGVIAGLATVTPASGFISPIGGLILGISGSVICFMAVNFVKHRLRIDDSLDVFAVHGVGGILGTFLVAFLAHPVFGGAGYAKGVTIGDQVLTQVIGIGAVVAWSAFVTMAIVMVARSCVGLRADPEAIIEGLDMASHGERGYSLNG